MIDINLLNIITIAVISLLAWALLQFGQRFTGVTLIAP